MRDYATLANPPQTNRKRVTIQRDIDWWAERLFKYIGKMLYLIIFSLIIFFITFFIRIGDNNQLFPLKNIIMLGDNNITNTKDIQNILENFKKVSFFSTNLDKVSKSIENLPWVEKAIVSRKWPSDLVIDITERVPYFRWKDSYLSDKNGITFKNTKKLFSNLPNLSGPEGSEQTVINHYQMYHNLFEHGNDLIIDKFILNKYLSWEVHLKNKTVIKLGREDFKPRVIRLSKAYSSGRIPNLIDVDIIDLRYNNGFAIKWRRKTNYPLQEDSNLMHVKQTKI